MARTSLNKYNLFGVKIQGATGLDNEGQTDGYNVAPGATDWVFMPFVDEPTFKWMPHSEPIDQADRIHHDHLLYPGGEWYEGSVSVNLVPGAVSTLTSLIQTRDAYNQGVWFSVYLLNYDSAERHNVWASNVKVARAELAIETGSPIRLTMDMVGLSEGIGTKPTIADVWDANITTPEIAPYICKETTFLFDATNGSGSYSAPTAVNYDIASCNLSIDNQLQDPAEGMRFNGSSNPYRLYNEGGVKVTGSFSRDYVDSAVYDAFRNMYRATAGWYVHDNTGALKITMTRGATSLNIEVPRLGYNDHSSGMRGSRSGRMVESVDFIALGDRTVTAPGTPSTSFPIYLS